MKIEIKGPMTDHHGRGRDDGRRGGRSRSRSRSRSRH